MPRRAGVRRWMWDLRFDPEPWSDALIARVDGMLRARLEAVQGADFADEIAAAYDAFRAADSDTERVAAARAAGIGGGFRGGRGSGAGAELRDAMQLPEAGVGTYFLELTLGDETYTGTLRVSPDPILEAR